MRLVTERRKKVPRICKRCGMGFRADPCIVALGKAKFCCRSCWSQYRSEHRVAKPAVPRRGKRNVTRYAVVGERPGICGDPTPCLWGEYASRAEANAHATAVRERGYTVRVERWQTQVER